MSKELNKKLAEWAGFTTEQVRVQGLLDVLVYEPSGKEYVGDLPNFTESLDACFKWLVPKAISLIQQVFHLNETEAYRTLFKWWNGMLEETMEHPSTLFTVTYPALSLCLAIEQLIDSVGK